ncbi:MAG: beta-lactamase family protein [Candidatus Eisenbacteria bacterium]|uniref:Beta-lactamase family protein n=1 Tax=Eiseniibacteriota bacterium TaxID=2212470 RepID=A0A948W6W8_UNCEI|nr:beta-lactamase family protein [Candidatus Eisenbacteria bacterium]MBU1948549.1 beta-lactamase family protein [Candidatus Eisenbacteria bacterium]MBU2691061.1 beta-lactamase family protein [Candidatus Eisenbacteria bacterium]
MKRIVSGLLRPVCIVLLLSAAAMSCPAQADLSTDSKDSYARAISQSREAIRKMMESSGVPGVSVAVFIDDREIWSEPFGFSDIEQKIPVTKETKFGIGSISKVLTTALCARLVDEGKLDWDAPIEKYLPGFEHGGHGISIRQIASHLSGLPTGFDKEYMYTTRHFETTQEVLDLYLQQPLEDIPGERVLYATTSYTVIAAVIESVLKKNFLSCMDEFLLQPLKLTHTVPNDRLKEIPNCTEFYVGNRKKEISKADFHDPSYKWAGAGYLSTADDMARFGSALLNSDYLRPETVQDIFNRQLTNEGGLTRYAIGWEIGTAEKGKKILIKSGGGPGISSYLAVYPEEGMVVAILSNMSKAPVSGRLFKQISDAFLEAKE